MKPRKQNRVIFAATGIVLTGLPAQYVRNHPEKIIVDLEGISTDDAGPPEEAVTFDVTFLFPELRAGSADPTGLLTIDLKSHPNNRRLVELIRYMEERDVELEMFGRQYEDRFYVNALYPSDNDCMSRKAFFYFASRCGLTFRYPKGISTEESAEEAGTYLELKYRLFRDRYPEGIQRYIDDHLENYGDRDTVLRFLRMDWGPPVLALPTAEEAGRILDQTVYGMEEVKERILEFLEVIRRSGSIAKNLLLIGPPETGKTTLMQAVSRVLKLPMSVVPMSACADLESFVGFARTYTGSQEGLFTTKLLSPVLECADGSRRAVHQIAQVVFLNELDKTDAEGKRGGSVQSAVLRMADDNRSFFDAYHQVNIDLSNVMIVADANDRSKIQKAVLDRFEVIEIPAYTEEEKAEIFRKYTFPKELAAQKVDPSEVAVTEEAVALIVSSLRTAGARELKQIAGRIIGNYLRHHSESSGTVRYTPEMVRPFLPARNVRNTTLVRQPGSIHAVAVSENMAANASVQCISAPSREWRFHLYGVSDELVRQELEAAAVCAAGYLGSGNLDVKVQVYGVINQVRPGQLGFPVFISVISAALNCVVDGVFHGGTTLLGDLTCAACDDPDAVMSLAERSGEQQVYTARGFAERMRKDHGIKVCEFLDAETAAAVLFGIDHLKAAG